MSQKSKAFFTQGNVPPGGICLSSFVVLTTGKDVLVGKMSKPSIWVERFYVGEQFIPRYISSGKYILPASHLAWYESPLDAAERVVKEQTLLPLNRKHLKLVEVQSHLAGDPSNKDESPHWDICFVYQGKVPRKIAKNLKKPDWFDDFGFVERSRLTPDHFTRGHGDVLQHANAIGKSAAKKKKPSD